MDWKALIDKTLGTHFNAPVYDPATGRAKLVKVIDKAAEQHKDGKTPPTRSWKLGSNKAISFAPTLNGNPVMLQGEAISYVPAERFQDFLSGLKAAVQAGDLDDEIKATLDGESSSGTRGGKAAQRSRGTSSAGKSEDANHPSVARSDYASMTTAQKQSVSRLYRNGKNADGSLIADVGHKPDAALTHKAS